MTPRFWHRTLPRLWQQRGLFAWMLRPVALLYGLLLHRQRQHWLAAHPEPIRLPAVVVVVGNVLVGGSGKTPTTMALVTWLQARGLACGVISRGHGRSAQGLHAVQAEDSASLAGDEPLLIRRRCGVPVWVGADRVAAARALLAAHPEVQVIVSDDGLQHWALPGDIRLCLFDERGLGNGWLLPAGPLREPWPREVELILHTGPGEPRVSGAWRATRHLAPEAVNGHGQRMDLSALARQPVDAVAALARPEAFFRMVQAQGLTLQTRTALPDHDDFSGWRPTTPLTRPLICTEKDAVKLWAHCPEAWALPLELSPEPGFWAALEGHLASALNTLSSRHGSQTA